MFRASLCPSSGEQECALPHMVLCTGSDGCGCVELGRELCASWRLLFDSHTACVPAPHNHRHHYQCRTPYAAVHTLVLLMMGVMMPETCWDKSLIMNIRLVASCWFLSLHPTFVMHGRKSLKKAEKTDIYRVTYFFLLTVNFIYSWAGNYVGLLSKVLA